MTGRRTSAVLKTIVSSASLVLAMCGHHSSVQAKTLVDLATQRFGSGEPKQLKAVDRDFFESVEKGEPFFRASSKAEENDPSKGKDWGPDRVLRANRIRWLCRDSAARKKVTPSGIWVGGLRIDGLLDLSNVEISFPLTFISCALPSGVSLNSAKTRDVSFANTHMKMLWANNVVVDGSIALGAGSKATSGVTLLNAIIRGSLNCVAAHLSNPGGSFALDGRGMTVDHGVFLNTDVATKKRFVADEQVTLEAAKIIGELHCEGARFNKSISSDVALDISAATIDGAVNLTHEFKANGSVRLLRTKITGDLVCQGRFLNQDARAINADQVQVGGSVFLGHDDDQEPLEAKGMVDLTGATIGGFLIASRAKFRNPRGYAILADSIDIGLSLRLGDGFEADGQVDFSAAHIHGGFECTAGKDGCKFKNTGFKLLDDHFAAINAPAMDVEGSVIFNPGVKVEGEIRLSYSSIGVNLVCRQLEVELSHSGGYSLCAEGVKVQGDLYFQDKCILNGQVSLAGASVLGMVSFEQVEFSDGDGYALFALDMRAGRGTVFVRCVANGGLSLERASIGSGLEFVDCKLKKGEGHYALYGVGVVVGGSVLFAHDFAAQGPVNLDSAQITGNLKCYGRFAEADSIALSLDSIKVGRSVHMSDSFSATGQVSIVAGTIDGDLLCTGGKFSSEGRYALCAASLRIKGSVLLRRKPEPPPDRFEAKGEVNFTGATIGGDLDCEGGHFSNSDGDALQAQGAVVDGSVILRDGFRADGVVTLRGSTVGRFLILKGLLPADSMDLDLHSLRVDTLSDDEQSWPSKEHLSLHGLVYREIDNHSPIDAGARLRWLRLQPCDRFSPQPYEQLAKYLRDRGDEDAARQILIAKVAIQAGRPGLGWSERLWYRWFGPLIGWGYLPWRAFWVALAIIALGACFFRMGNAGNPNERVMTPVQDPFPIFNSLVYSFDAFVPLINMHQASYWLPGAKRGKRLCAFRYCRYIVALPVFGMCRRYRWWRIHVARPLLALRTGSLLRSYLWLHTLAGWTLSTLFAVSMTGLVKS